MIMVPLPIVLSILAFAIFLREWYFQNMKGRNGWFGAFLVLLAFQEMLIGLRFGYSFETLARLQPFSAALIPPLAYLSFKRPSLKHGLLFHGLPIVFLIFAIFINRDFIDAFLAVNNFFYCMVLAQLGRGGSNNLAWLKFRNTKFALGLLWVICLLLFTSGLTDAVIWYDFFVTNGDNTSAIAGWASVGAVIISLMIYASLLMWQSQFDKRTCRQNIQSETENFEIIEKFMHREHYFIDPDINLNRIARRLSMPVRDVSRAINSQTNQSVSQYVNNLRIEEACKMLKGSDLQITQIIFRCGFNTKSNFNREFDRVMGQTPTDWRSLNS